MSFVEAEFDGTPVVVCRTGYTGERGYELVVPDEVVGLLWDTLFAAGEQYGVTACGLGARDTLRTEMGYPLHGQDITRDVTPNEARLGWAVGWKKDRFWGRSVLLEEKEAGPRRVLRGLVATGRGIPRPGMRVLLVSDVPLGEVTSDVLPDPAQGHRPGAHRRAGRRGPGGVGRRTRAPRGLHGHPAPVRDPGVRES